MPKILFNATEEEKELWVELAAKQKVTLSEWLRQAARAKATPPRVLLGVTEPPLTTVRPNPEVVHTAMTPAEPPASFRVGEVKERPAPQPVRDFKPDFKDPPKPKKPRR